MFQRFPRWSYGLLGINKQQPHLVASSIRPSSYLNAEWVRRWPQREHNNLTMFQFAVNALQAFLPWIPSFSITLLIERRGLWAPPAWCTKFWRGLEEIMGNIPTKHPVFQAWSWVSLWLCWPKGCLKEATSKHPWHPQLWWCILRAIEIGGHLNLLRQRTPLNFPWMPS